MENGVLAAKRKRRKNVRVASRKGFAPRDLDVDPTSYRRSGAMTDMLVIDGVWLGGRMPVVF